jgi:hypothetical protein
MQDSRQSVGIKVEGENEPLTMIQKDKCKESDGLKTFASGWPSICLSKRNKCATSKEPFS